MNKNDFATLAAGPLLAVSLLGAPGPTQAQIYYRVEAGYSQSFDADFKDKDFAADHVNCGDPNCRTAGSFEDVGSAVILSAGLGYRFTPYMRAEVALGYRGGYEVDGQDKFITPGRYTADVTSWSLMANGYYDFPLDGWTPYVGAGVGLALNKIDTFTFSDNAGFSGSAAGKTTGDFAWGLMVGVGFRGSSRFTLDVGYRYIDLGWIETGSGTQTFINRTTPYAGAQGRLKANELIVALRF